MAPPPPGLSAILAGGGNRVEVTLDTGHPPDRCRPVFASLLLDDLDDEVPPVTAAYRIDALGPQQLNIRVPDHFSSAPDVIRGSLATRGRTASSVVSVLVRK